MFCLGYMKISAQSGVAHILLLVAAVGVVGFILVSASAEFKDQIFSTLFPKQASQAAPVNSNPAKLSWIGSNWNVTGANVPWYNWACDFGCNNNGGVMSTRTTLSVGFQRLRDAGVHVARWWVFPGDPWQITRDSSGAPTGLNPSIYADFDAALQLAEQYDLYYDFVLFSAATHPPRSWIDDPTQRAQLAQVLGPLFARYRDNPRVMSWEIFNEPEWQIWNNLIGQANTVATAAVIADSIHTNSNAYATLGQATIDGLPMWSSVNLDYYSPHWYPSMTGNGCAICQTTDQIRARWPSIGNKPIVIGEIYAGSDANPLNNLNTLYNNGYAGAWAWSLFSDRTNDRLTVDFTALTTFTSQHSDIGPRAGVTPSSTPAPTIVPTSTPVSTPTPTSPPTLTPTPIGSLLPGAPTITPLVSCLSSATSADVVRISWVNPVGGNPVSWVDLSSSSIFSSFYNKAVSGTSTNGASGFALYPQRTTILTINPNATYFVRLYNNDPNNGHSPVTSFLLPNCPSPTPSPTPIPTSTPAPVGGSTVRIYAAGTPSNSLYPNMSLIINGTTVRSFNSVRGDPNTRNFLEFSYSSPIRVSHEQVRVRFTNDSNGGFRNDRNLVIDRINIDGVDYQSEAPSVYSTGTWNAATGCRSGFKQSEWLHCNGYFEYR